jgi:propionyl-CoA synthetase
MNYETEYRRSIDDPQAFWQEAAQAIYWETPPAQILDATDPAFRRWFVGGRTNLCFNAVDRHLAERGEQLALIAVSTETGITQEWTYRQLHRAVNTFAATLKSLGADSAHEKPPFRRMGSQRSGRWEASAVIG